MDIGGDSAADCFLVVHPEFDRTATAFDNDGEVYRPANPAKLCHEEYPDCGDQVQVDPANPFSGCQGPMRTVNIVSATNGTVVATVAGSAVQDGESATSAEPVTFTAIPAGDGFYVSLWTGNCSAAANGANDNAGGLPKTCVVPAGASPIQAGAAFAPVADCAAQNRNPGTNIRTCGNCKGGRVPTEESKTCVPSNQKAEADNCETAGWSVTPNGENCAIRVSIVATTVSHDSCDFVSECEGWFVDRQDGEVTFPQSSGPGDTRRFVVRCDEGKNPSAGNDAGQTMCCDEPTTQDPTTGQCQVTADSCRSFNLNAEPHPTDNTKCVCKSGFTGEPPACRGPAPGLLPTGIPVTTATIGPDDIPGAGNIPGAGQTAKCETIGGTAQSYGSVHGCNIGTAFVNLNDSASDGLTFWRNCALQRRGVEFSGSLKCLTNPCPSGQVVRNNACVPGTWNQCNELSGVSTPAYACDANATCSDSSESTIETAAQLCTCNQGYTGDGTPGNCAPNS